MERKTTYTVHSQAPTTQRVVVEQQQPQVVHHVHHRHHRYHYHYGGGLLGAMARAVSDDLYGPRYVVTEQHTQQPVQTTVQVTTNTSRPAAPPRQTAPPRPTPPRAVPPRPSPPYAAAAAPKVKAVDCFQLGNVLELQSKLSGDRLMLDSDGLLSCNGNGGPACQFKVRSSGRPGVYKLQNIAQPKCYLGYSEGYIIGYGKGDKDCDFIVSMVQDHYVTLENCRYLGNVLGSLPSGDITDPSQTKKDSEVAQFAPHVIA